MAALSTATRMTKWMQQPLCIWFVWSAYYSSAMAILSFLTYETFCASIVHQTPITYHLSDDRPHEWCARPNKTRVLRWTMAGGVNQLIWQSARNTSVIWQRSVRQTICFTVRHTIGNEITRMSIHLFLPAVVWQKDCLFFVHVLEI